MARERAGVHVLRDGRVCRAVACAQVAQVAAVRIALKEVAQERTACKHRKVPFQEDRSVVRVAAAVCWWRCCVGRAVSVSPFIVLPDRCRRLLTAPGVPLEACCVGRITRALPPRVHWQR